MISIAFRCFSSIFRLLFDCLLLKWLSDIKSKIWNRKKHSKGGDEKSSWRKKLFKKYYSPLPNIDEEEAGWDSLGSDEEDANPHDETVTSPTILAVKRINQPTVRFSVDFDKYRNIMYVNILDAFDLPPMDADGKADPYIEVSIKPGGKKYTTSTKTDCLNPVFNETAVFYLTSFDLDGRDLVLKAYDSDFPLKSELIGVLRLPISQILATNNRGKIFSCLLIKESKKLSGLPKFEAARLNLKLAEYNVENCELRKKIDETKGELKRLIQENEDLRSEVVRIEMKKMIDSNGKLNIDEVDAARSGVNKDEDTMSVRSAPEIMEGIESRLERKTSRRDESVIKLFKLISHLQHSLKTKDQELKRLTALPSWNMSRTTGSNGTIDLGLTFSPDASQFRLEVIKASDLPAVNIDGKSSDPFVKVKVTKVGRKKPQKWKFETKTVWRCLSPIWNESFVVPTKIDMEDLKSSISLEVMVMDKGRIRSAQVLGKAVLGPVFAQSRNLWRSMIANPGVLVCGTLDLQEP